MSLFQKSVEKKYLNEIESSFIDEKFNVFQSYFGNAEIQENIRNSKEEQFQEGFLRELFVKILDYTLNPEPNFNLTTELKNIANAKKADGAILKNDNAIAVIELKSTSTTDLDSVEDQAFGYKNHHPKCIYVITSNFEKLRFYIQNAVEYVEFDLFNLSKDSFALMWLCLSKDNILKDLPLKIKESSVLQEENVTKKLYADYSKFRESIFDNIVKNNSEIDKLLLFKKTQKLLDRFLFVFFAEDRLLLPPNSISEIVKQWTDLKEKYDEYFPLYDRFKKYFGYMNSGFKGKQYDIYPYNGGLFVSDEILDTIKIDDEVLYEHTLKLSTYDFETEVDVNILGHIFEHSLGEIENVQAEIQGQSIDKQKSKRKKDGIFYTPKYITKYIVENTVGKLCAEKREKLKIIDEDFTAKRNKSTKKKLIEKLDNYREWLLSLTILDPACGSGAFLNQALDFLVEEHHKIDALKTQLLGGGLIFSDIETDILEKNIYGVDLNEESVEIAKLSLWLRTARKGRKLNTLSNNIKCGNSLIDDPEIAGEKAFNWEMEFPEIFKNGGFDVTIGNPPYVNVELMPKLDKDYYNKNYDAFYKRSDLFSLFVDLALERLTTSGYISFIIPSIILNNLSYKIIREKLLNNNWLEDVCYTGGKVFSDVTVDTVVICINKKGVSKIKLINALDFNIPKSQEVDINYFEKYQNTISIGSSESNSIFDKLFSSEFYEVDEYFNVFQGIVTGNNSSYIFESKEEIIKVGLEEKLLETILLGRDIGKWLIKDSSKKILYIDSKTNILDYPATQNWLLPFKEKLELRRECKRGVIPWYSLQWARDKKELDKKPKIILQRTRNESLKTRIVATIDEDGVYGMESLIFLTPKTSEISVYYFLGILNSKLINYLFATKFLNLAVKGDYLKKIKFPISNNTTNLDSISKKMIHLNKEITQNINKFSSYLKSNFQIKKLSNKLQNWHELEFADFIKELNKTIKKASGEKLTKKDEMEWMELFDDYKSQANYFKEQIDKTDKEIDQMVYQLYGLTEEEIQIVENSI